MSCRKSSRPRFLPESCPRTHAESNLLPALPPPPRLLILSILSSTCCCSCLLLAAPLVRSLPFTFHQSTPESRLPSQIINHFPSNRRAIHHLTSTSILISTSSLPLLYPPSSISTLPVSRADHGCRNQESPQRLGGAERRRCSPQRHGCTSRRR